jgi:hypothetical protein
MVAAAPIRPTDKTSPRTSIHLCVLAAPATASTLVPGQAGGRHADHDGVVARQHQVDDDDLAEGGQVRGERCKVHWLAA